MSSHFLLYSHGFGVRKDSRGMFTDIVAALPDFQHEMFDYNSHDEATNRTFITPLSGQVEILHKKINDLRQQEPTATIDLIAHSQGCIVAGMAASPEIRKTILLAPPADNVGDRKKSFLLKRPGVTSEEDGTIHIPRRDGSVSVISPEYWNDWNGLDPTSMYNRLPGVSVTILIIASEDEVLPHSDFSRLSPEIDLQEIAADHNFTGNSRMILSDTLRTLL